MAWTKNRKESKGIPQIVLVHIYRDAAHLNDGEYRYLLKSHTLCGAFSSKDPQLTQYDFDVVMAILEAKVDDYHRANPSEPLPRQITNLRYWRNRRPVNGEMNSRERHRIFELWEQLQPYLDDDQRNNKYLASVASRACAYYVQDIWDLKAWQARLLIEALKDRIHYATRRGNAA